MLSSRESANLEVELIMLGHERSLDNKVSEICSLVVFLILVEVTFLALLLFNTTLHMCILSIICTFKFLCHL